MKSGLKFFWLRVVLIVLLHILLYTSRYTGNLAYAKEDARIQMSVPSPEKVKAGEMITFQVLVVNEGTNTWETGTYSTTIDIYDDNKIFKVTTESTGEGPSVPPGESALFFIPFKTPDRFGGQYFYKVNLKYNRRAISTSDYYTFTVIPIIRGAGIAITNTIGDQKFGSEFKVSCQVKNRGELNYSFPVEILIKTPVDVISIPVKTVSLAPGQSNVVEFSCSIPSNAPDGIYAAIASVYDRLENEKPVQKYNEATQEFKVIDSIPTIQFLNLGLSAVKGEEISLKVRVIDDGGIQSVRIKYQIPGMSEKKTKDMENISGTKQDGVWIFKTAAFSETGKFIFTIEAIDNKLQVSKVEYQTTVVTQ